jgi:hypothetical protein
LRNLHPDFHSSCTSLHSHQECMRVPLSSYPHQLLLFVFLLIANITGMRWNLSITLICISFMTKDAKHLYVY